jgi:hypothetical protein
MRSILGPTLVLAFSSFENCTCLNYMHLKASGKWVLVARQNPFNLFSLSLSVKKKGECQ